MLEQENLAPCQGADWDIQQTDVSLRAQYNRRKWILRKAGLLSKQ